MSLLQIISNFSTFAPFVIGSLLLKSPKLTKDLILLIFFWGIGGITEILFLIFNSNGIKTAWLINVYTIVEYLMVAFIFLQWQQNSRGKQIIYLSIPLYLIIFFYAKLSGFEAFDPATINYFSRPVALLLLCGIAIFTLYEIWYLKKDNLLYDYRFWILTAFIIYYTGSIIVFSLMFVKEQDSLLFLYNIHLVLNIFHNILFIIGIVCVLRFQQNRSSDEFAMNVPE